MTISEKIGEDWKKGLERGLEKDWEKHQVVNYVSFPSPPHKQKGYALRESGPRKHDATVFNRAGNPVDPCGRYLFRSRDRSAQTT